MKVLVTGGTGFAGLHLVEQLQKNGKHVIATSNNHANLPEDIEVVQLDLTDAQAVGSLDFTEIEAVFHLAGLAAVGASFTAPNKYLEVNAGIQFNLFEECIKQKAKPRFLIVSSGNVYDPKSPLPLTESSPVKPTSPYAISKLAQETIGQYYGGRGFEVVFSRSFNHMGPGQQEGFIVADFAKQIALAEKNGEGKILHGNLDAKRDYTDVRDIARAYSLLIEKGRPGETYNICSGHTVSGHEILSGLLNLTDARIEPARDESLMRPVDNPEIYGSNHKINQDTHWQPEIPLEKTLAETLEYWRSRV